MLSALFIIFADVMRIDIITVLPEMLEGFFNESILARAHNLTETLHDVTAHAEMQALTAAANSLGAKYLTDCTLYVTVEPCVMCAGAIAWSQVGRLVFGAEDEKRGYQRYAPQALHPKTVVVKGVLADECAGLMKDFFRKKR